MKNHKLNSLGWLALVGLVSLLLCAPFFRVIYYIPDEGIFLRAAEMILRGKRLYADFFGFLAPGSYLLTAAWFDIAGVSISSARILAVLTVAGIACFTFLACRQASKSASLSAVLAIFWVMLSQWHWMQVSHHWFTTFFAMVAAWAALASLEQPTERPLRWPLIAGLAAGAATMITQTRGAWVALAALVAFFDLRQSPSKMAAYLLGGISVLVCIIAFLAEQGTLAAAFHDVVVFAGTRYAFIQIVPFGHSTLIFDWPLKYAFPLAALLLLLVIIRDRTCVRHRQLQVSAALALAGFLGCFPRPDITHIGFSVPLTLPLLAFCAKELTQRARPATRYAITAAVVIGLGIPSAAAFAVIARTAYRAPVVPTPRGEAAFIFPEGMSELLPVIAAVPPQDGFFFYPHLSLLSFLAKREHVSKYDVFIPWYTTPAQYQDACISMVRQASWVVMDRRYLDYAYWKQAYPSMPAAKPRELIRFEDVLNRAFIPVTARGSFDLRRRREGVTASACRDIAETGLRQN